MNRGLFFALMLLIGSAEAGVVTGFVEKMIIGREGHQVFIHIKDAPQTCGQDHNLGFNYAFSLRDHGAGKEMLSAFMAAQVANKQVTIQGTGHCTVDAKMEDVSYLYLRN